MSAGLELRGLTRPGAFFALPENPKPHSPFRVQNRIRLAVGKEGEPPRHVTGWVDNIMNTFGLASLASMVGSGAGVNASTLISTMKIGTDTTAATSTDGGLGASTAQVHITAASLTKTNLGNRTVEYQATFASNNPAGTYVANEVGIFCNSTGNNQMGARSVLGTNSVNKGNSDTINVSYQLIFITA